jgi:hypothetical protein
MAAATMFLDTVLDALNQCSGSSVAYSLILNRGHTGGSSGSSDGGTKSRPDMLLAVNSCTVVLGHFSHNQDMMPGAVAELVGKLGAMDSHQYRPLPYIFGITGVGSQLQLHILSAKLGRLQVSDWAAPLFDADACLPASSCIPTHPACADRAGDAMHRCCTPVWPHPPRVGAVQAAQPAAPDGQVPAPTLWAQLPLLTHHHSPRHGP